MFVGMIYANAYKYCNAIDMNKTKDSRSEVAIQEAISKSLIEWTMAKYGKSAKEASEFLIGNSILKLRKDIKEQEVGFTLNSWHTKNKIKRYGYYLKTVQCVTVAI